MHVYLKLSVCMSYSEAHEIVDHTLTLIQFCCGFMGSDLALWQGLRVGVLTTFSDITPPSVVLIILYFSFRRLCFRKDPSSFSFDVFDFVRM